MVEENKLKDEIEERYIDMERRKRWIKREIEKLKERELKIIRERRMDDDGVKMEEMGEKIGI